MRRDTFLNPTPYPRPSRRFEAETESSAAKWYLLGAGGIVAVVCAIIAYSGPADPPGRSTPKVTTPAARVAPPTPAVDPPTGPKPTPRPLFDTSGQALPLSDFVRLKEASLDDAQKSEKAGRFQEALDAIDEAEKNGARKVDLEPVRARLRAGLADCGKVDDAFARAEQLLSLGDYDKALAELHSVDGAARKVNRAGELDERTASVTSARDRAKKLSSGAGALDKARELMDASDLPAARAEVEKARTLIPGSPELTRVETRLVALEHLPAGMLYVELEGDRALYVRKLPVTNADFKKWIDDTGRGGAAPWKGTYPANRGDSPVLGVFLDAAKNFAASRGERLPAEDEWPAIRKALHLANDAGRAQAGVLVNGFYTVKNP